MSLLKNNKKSMETYNDNFNHRKVIVYQEEDSSRRAKIIKVAVGIGAVLGLIIGLSVSLVAPISIPIAIAVVAATTLFGAAAGAANGFLFSLLIGNKQKTEIHIEDKPQAIVRDGKQRGEALEPTKDLETKKSKTVRFQDRITGSENKNHEVAMQR